MNKPQAEFKKLKETVQLCCDSGLYEESDTGEVQHLILDHKKTTQMLCLSKVTFAY